MKIKMDFVFQTKSLGGRAKRKRLEEMELMKYKWLKDATDTLASSRNIEKRQLEQQNELHTLLKQQEDLLKNDPIVYYRGNELKAMSK